MASVDNSYKTFIISKWDSDATGLTQYATTWQIAKDIDFNDLVIDNQKDTVNLYEWKVNIVIPKDEVWYIRAKRHLKDSDGNDVVYDKYIGPEPIISDESNVNELLIPDMYIEQPSILNYTMDSSSITINIADPIGNVPNIKTILGVYYNNKMLYSTKTTDTTIVITPDNVDYTGLDKFDIVLVHEGDFGVISNTTHIKVSYSDNLFTIVGNLRNLDPIHTNIIKVVAKEANGIRVSYASVVDMDTGNIISCPVRNSSDVYIEPSKLKHDDKLVLKIYVEYIDPNTNETKTVEKDYPIAFKQYSEVDTEIENVTYLYVIEYYAETSTIPMDKHVVIAEETSTGVIPVIRDNKIDLITITPDNNDFIDVNTNTGVSYTDTVIASNLQIVDINGTDYLITMINTGNETNIYLYDINYVKNTISTAKKTYTVSNTQIVSNNSLFYFRDKLCIGYLNNSNVEIYSIDDTLDTLTLIETVTLPSDTGSLTEVVVNNIDESNLAILPIGQDVTYNYIYNGTYNKLETGDNIPDSLRGKRVTGIRQLNGNILYTPLETSVDVYTFMAYDRVSNSLNEYKNDIGTTNPLINTIMFKDRTLDKLYIDTTTKIYTLR